MNKELKEFIVMFCQVFATLMVLMTAAFLFKFVLIKWWGLVPHIKESYPGLIYWFWISLPATFLFSLIVAIDENVKSSRTIHY